MATEVWMQKICYLLTVWWKAITCARNKQNPFFEVCHHFFDFYGKGLLSVIQCTDRNIDCYYFMLQPRTRQSNVKYDKVFQIEVLNEWPPWRIDEGQCTLIYDLVILSTLSLTVTSEYFWYGCFHLTKERKNIVVCGQTTLETLKQ